MSPILAHPPYYHVTLTTQVSIPSTPSLPVLTHNSVRPINPSKYSTQACLSHNPQLIAKNVFFRPLPASCMQSSKNCVCCFLLLNMWMACLWGLHDRVDECCTTVVQYCVVFWEFSRISLHLSTRRAGNIWLLKVVMVTMGITWYFLEMLIIHCCEDSLVRTRWPSQHLLVQSKQWKHQNNGWNPFKVNNKKTRPTSMKSLH